MIRGQEHSVMQQLTCLTIAKFLHSESNLDRPNPIIPASLPRPTDRDRVSHANHMMLLRTPHNKSRQTYQQACGWSTELHWPRAVGLLTQETKSAPSLRTTPSGWRLQRGFSGLQDPINIVLPPPMLFVKTIQLQRVNKVIANFAFHHICERVCKILQYFGSTKTKPKAVLQSGPYPTSAQTSIGTREGSTSVRQEATDSGGQLGSFLPAPDNNRGITNEVLNKSH